MKRYSRWVWLIVAVLGWLLDFLFWKQPPGFNFAAYVAFCLVGGFVLLHWDRRTLAPRAAWLLPLIFILAVITFLRAEPLTWFLAVVLTLLLMAVLAITFVGGRWLEYGMWDYVLGLLRLAWSTISQPLAFRAEISRDHRSGADSGGGAWPVSRGLLIALPVLVLFAALLASADLVFGRELDAFTRLLRLEHLPQYVFRLVYISLAAYALLGVYLHAALKSRDDGLLDRARPNPAQFLGFVEAAIVLGSVAVLFSAFVLVQFRYFFGGQTNIGLEGFTYSEYARRGYGELMAVALFSLLMVLGLGAVTERRTRLHQRVFSALGVLIMALVSVMLLSAYMRLSLYENAYGFSRLRTYVHVSLIWLGLLLAAVVVLELLHRERLFALAALVASLGFAVTLAVVNVDAFVARRNVERASQGEDLDVAYLVSLSTDAVPALAGIFTSPAYPAATHDAVGAVLACHQTLHPVREDSDWRSFSVSRWQAANALRSVGGALAPYKLAEPEGPIHILSPAKVLYDCAYYHE